VCSPIENKTDMQAHHLRVREENSMGRNNAPRQKWENYSDMFADALIRFKYDSSCPCAQ